MSDFFSLMEFIKSNVQYTSDDEIPGPVATRFMENLIKDLTQKEVDNDVEE